MKIDNMETKQSSNPLIRFLDSQTVEIIKDIKKSEDDTKRQKESLKKTLYDAQVRLLELTKMI